MKGEKEMKQYTKPEFYFVELFEDLLTISTHGDLNEDNIVFDWENL